MIAITLLLLIAIVLLLQSWFQRFGSPRGVLQASICAPEIRWPPSFRPPPEPDSTIVLFFWWIVVASLLTILTQIFHYHHRQHGDSPTVVLQVPNNNKRHAAESHQPPSPRPPPEPDSTYITARSRHLWLCLTSGLLALVPSRWMPPDIITCNGRGGSLPNYFCSRRKPFCQRQLIADYQARGNMRWLSIGWFGPPPHQFDCCVHPPPNAREGEFSSTPTSFLEVGVPSLATTHSSSKVYWHVNNGISSSRETTTLNSRSATRDLQPFHHLSCAVECGTSEGAAVMVHRLLEFGSLCLTDHGHAAASHLPPSSRPPPVPDSRRQWIRLQWMTIGLYAPSGTVWLISLEQEQWLELPKSSCGELIHGRLCLGCVDIMFTPTWYVRIISIVVVVVFGAIKYCCDNGVFQFCGRCTVRFVRMTVVAVSWHFVSVNNGTSSMYRGDLLDKLLAFKFLRSNFDGWEDANIIDIDLMATTSPKPFSRKLSHVWFRPAWVIIVYVLLRWKCCAVSGSHDRLHWAASELPDLDFDCGERSVYFDHGDDGSHLLCPGHAPSATKQQIFPCGSLPLCQLHFHLSVMPAVTLTHNSPVWLVDVGGSIDFASGAVNRLSGVYWISGLIMWSFRLHFTGFDAPSAPSAPAASCQQICTKSSSINCFCGTYNGMRELTTTNLTLSNFQQHVCWLPTTNYQCNHQDHQLLLGNHVPYFRCCKAFPKTNMVPLHLLDAAFTMFTTLCRSDLMHLLNSIDSLGLPESSVIYVTTLLVQDSALSQPSSTSLLELVASWTYCNVNNGDKKPCPSTTRGGISRILTSCSIFIFRSPDGFSSFSTSMYYAVSEGVTVMVSRFNSAPPTASSYTTTSRSFSCLLSFGVGDGLLTVGWSAFTGNHVWVCRCSCFPSVGVGLPEIRRYQWSFVAVHFSVPNFGYFCGPVLGSDAVEYVHCFWKLAAASSFMLDSSPCLQVKQVQERAESTIDFKSTHHFHRAFHLTSTVARNSQVFVNEAYYTILQDGSTGYKFNFYAVAIAQLLDSRSSSQSDESKTMGALLIGKTLANYLSNGDVNIYNAARDHVEEGDRTTIYNHWLCDASEVASVNVQRLSITDSKPVSILTITLNAAPPWIFAGTDTYDLWSHMIIFHPQSVYANVAGTRSAKSISALANQELADLIKMSPVAPFDCCLGVFSSAWVSLWRLSCEVVGTVTLGRLVLLSSGSSNGNDVGNDARQRLGFHPCCSLPEWLYLALQWQSASFGPHLFSVATKLICNGSSSCLVSVDDALLALAVSFGLVCNCLTYNGTNTTTTTHSRPHQVLSFTAQLLTLNDNAAQFCGIKDGLFNNTFMSASSCCENERWFGCSVPSASTKSLQCRPFFNSFEGPNNFRFLPPKLLYMTSVLNCGCRSRSSDLCSVNGRNKEASSVSFSGVSKATLSDNSSSDLPLAIVNSWVGLVIQNRHSLGHWYSALQLVKAVFLSPLGDVSDNGSVTIQDVRVEAPTSHDNFTAAASEGDVFLGQFSMYNIRSTVVGSIVPDLESFGFITAYPPTSLVQPLQVTTSISPSGRHLTLSSEPTGPTCPSDPSTIPTYIFLLAEQLGDSYMTPCNDHIPTALTSPTVHPPISFFIPPGLPPTNPPLSSTLVPPTSCQSMFSPDLPSLHPNSTSTNNPITLSTFRLVEYPSQSSPAFTSRSLSWIVNLLSEGAEGLTTYCFRGSYSYSDNVIQLIFSFSNTLVDFRCDLSTISVDIVQSSRGSVMRLQVCSQEALGRFLPENDLILVLSCSRNFGVKNLFFLLFRSVIGMFLLVFAFHVDKSNHS